MHGTLWDLQGPKDIYCFIFKVDKKCVKRHKEKDKVFLDDFYLPRDFKAWECCNALVRLKAAKAMKMKQERALFVRTLFLLA